MTVRRSSRLTCWVAMRSSLDFGGPSVGLKVSFESNAIILSLSRRYGRGSDNESSKVSFNVLVDRRAIPDLFDGMENESQNSHKYSAVIVGPGGLGASIAAQLQAAGHIVSVVGRHGPTDWRFAILNFGKLHQVILKKSLGAANNQPNAVFVCVRAYDLQQACRDVSEWAPGGTPVIVLGNGYFASELIQFQSLRPDLWWRPGMTSLAVTQVGEGDYESRNHAPFLRWGSLDKTSREEPLPDEGTLVGGLVGAQWSSNIAAEVRRKWIFNTALNTLCGAYQLPRNGLARNFEPQLALLFREAWQLAIELDGPTHMDPQEVWAQFLALIDATQNNENSMARDVRLHIRTESEYLAGRAVGRYDFPNLKKLHAVLCGL